MKALLPEPGDRVIVHLLNGQPVKVDVEAVTVTGDGIPITIRTSTPDGRPVLIPWTSIGYLEEAPA